MLDSQFEKKTQSMAFLDEYYFEDDFITINSLVMYESISAGKGAYTLQPTLRFLLFKHHLEVVCSTFCYQSI